MITERYGPTIVDRFKERNDDVKINIFGAYTTLLEASHDTQKLTNELEMK
jgi:hypothetical protein